MDLQEIQHQEGKDNIPGIDQVYLFKYTEVFSWPDVVQPNPETAGSVPDDLVTVNGNLLMRQNIQLIPVYHTDMTAEYKSELQGELDAKSFKQTLIMNIPSRASKLLGMLTGLKDTRLGAIIRLKGGETILMGGYGFPARLTTAPLTFGNNPTSNPMTVTTLECDDPVVTRLFNGLVKVGSGSYGGSGAGNFTQTLFAN